MLNEVEIGRTRCPIPTNTCSRIFKLKRPERIEPLEQIISSNTVTLSLLPTFQPNIFIFSLQFKLAEVEKLENSPPLE